MIEIDEMVPLYICERSLGSCFSNSQLCDDECKHTWTPIHAVDQTAVSVFEEFASRFNVCVDDYGRLICTEKETGDD